MKTTLQEEVPLKNRLFRKLNPNRFPRMSSLMAAIVGHILDAAFTQPSIAEIAVTSDGFVLARAEGQVGVNFIGTYADLLRNWFGLLAAAGLTTIEHLEAESLFASKIGYFGRTTA